MANCQSTVASRLFRSCSHDRIFSLTLARSGIRWLRHWPHRVLKSISAMLSQLPCLGVRWIRFTSRLRSGSFRT